MITELIQELKKHEDEIEGILIDCQDGNKFLVRDWNWSESDKAIVLKISPGSMKWVELNGKHPVVLTTDKIKV